MSVWQSNLQIHQPYGRSTCSFPFLCHTQDTQERCPSETHHLRHQLSDILYVLAKHLAKLLNHRVGKSKYHIKNSEHLVKLLKDISLEEDDVFVSYDVTALFTSVHCAEVVHIAVDRAKKDHEWYNRTKLTPEAMGELLTFSLNTPYFKFQGEFYQQVFRAAMGSPISPIITNMFMEMIEIKALATAPNPPHFCGWYVDNTGTV